MTQHKRAIWPQLLADGCVIDALWRDAITQRAFVGTCPECGGYLRPGAPYPQGRYRTGYTATCAGCEHEYGAMGPSDAPAQTTKKGGA